MVKNRALLHTCTYIQIPISNKKNVCWKTGEIYLNLFLNYECSR